MRILLDMDGVIVDFEGAVIAEFKRRHPEIPIIPPHERTTFFVKNSYPLHVQPLLEEIYFADGFYATLPSIPGALEAIKELEKQHELLICTSPLRKNRTCVPDKYTWLETHLGSEWIKRTVVADDKTVVLGDILIDDNPEIKGIQKPTWEHILYTQPYNAHIEGKRRLTWQNWKDILN